MRADVVRMKTVNKNISLVEFYLRIWEKAALKTGLEEK